MRANIDLKIVGDRVILVPYRREHVLAYHAWMQDPELQEATASEKLTLEEEYDMQASWAEDEQKCTFILLDPSIDDTEGTGVHGGGMVGDVNLYWNDHDEPNTAEIEIMVAEKQSRRKGLASEALMLFMAYTATKLGVTKFRAKIGDANKASQQLFSSLQYKYVSASKIFQEMTFELAAEDGGNKGEVAENTSERVKQWQELLEVGKALRIGTYD